MAHSAPEISVGLADLGYCILRSTEFQKTAAALRDRFERDFASRFSTDAGANRNLIKRFGDSLDVARFFCDPGLARAIRDIGIADPVFCGPVVTHYTSHDVTGQSYGLPFHQDWPSMASSDNSAVLWVSLTDSGPDTHGLEVAPGHHTAGLLSGTQRPNGFSLDQQDYANGVVVSVRPGDVVLMSPFLPHRTYVHPRFKGWKLSLSRRIDDLTCDAWPARGFANSYGTFVDRELYKKWL